MVIDCSVRLEQAVLQHDKQVEEITVAEEEIAKEKEVRGEGGREGGGRDGGREGGRIGGRERQREGEREGWEGGRERGREGGRGEKGGSR